MTFATASYREVLSCRCSHIQAPFADPLHMHRAGACRPPLTRLAPADPAPDQRVKEGPEPLLSAGPWLSAGHAVSVLRSRDARIWHPLGRVPSLDTRGTGQATADFIVGALRHRVAAYDVRHRPLDLSHPTDASEAGRA